MHPPRSTLALAIALAAGAAFAQPTTIPTTGYTGAVAELLPSGAGLERSDERILLALGAMDPPPSGVATLIEALLLTPAEHSWAEASQWADASPQRAALEALSAVTEPGAGHVFALPYGESDTPGPIVQTGLYNPLLEGDLLVTVDHAYLRALDRLFILVCVEAERLAAANDPTAPTPLVRWILLARQVADQAFFNEKLWAMRSMRLGLERLRDLIYRHPGLLTEQQVVDLVRELDPRALLIDRIGAPDGDRLAAQQLVAQTYVERRGPDPAKFGPTLARLGASGRPLSLFGEAGYFQQVASGQADYYEAIDAIDAAFNDWALRWDLPAIDPIWAQPNDYSRLDPARFTLLTDFTPDVTPLFAERLNLRTELLGTRLALGAVGYRAGQRVWPTDIFALRPRFVAQIDDDPYDRGTNRFREQRRESLKFFVPVRDQRRSEREDPRPHPVTIRAAAAWFVPAGHTGGDSAGALPPPDANTLTQFALAEIQGSLGAVPDEDVRGAADRVFAFLDQQRIELATIQERLEQMDEDELRQWPGQADAARLLDRIQGKPESAVIDPGPGGDLAARRAAIAAYLERLLSNSSFAQVYDAHRRSREPITSEAARVVLLALVEPLVRAQAEALAPTLIKADFGPQEFTVNLTDAVFVLYSKGPDARADWARRVGAGGTDLLIWPPVLSLLRADIEGTDPLAPWKQ